ncbi:MAG: aldehyde dehydrogenase family protein, partial [Candidatus Methanomethylophilaceae archaeon]|nr:aldehyde dehydrogenase family protein [Candidatus Methanomethylophilaceae archaeon]
ALESIVLQKYKLAGLVTVCSGMTRDEAFDEVERLIEVIDQACQDMIDGAKGKPEGVWAVLTEYNSPLAAPMGYCAAAILAGNTVVVMPSKYAPVPVFYIYDILVNAGLPDGVLNVIVDRFDASTASLANNLDAIGVVAAGSGDRLEDLIFLQTDEELRFINELKGMNPVFVYKPGSMKDAAKKIVRSAFTCAGQRVDACSKVIVTEDEQKALVSAILEEVKSVKVGDPAEIDTVMGPIMTKSQFELFEQIVKKFGDYLIYGGKRIVNEITEGGYYVTPAVFMGVPEDSDLCSIDNALPILVITTVAEGNDAIDEINYTEYGLSAGIITKDEEMADRFIREVNADEVFVNDPSVVIGPACKAKVRNFLA